jgi:hypothetical protein
MNLVVILQQNQMEKEMEVSTTYVANGEDEGFVMTLSKLTNEQMSYIYDCLKKMEKKDED